MYHLANKTKRFRQRNQTMTSLLHSMLYDFADSFSGVDTILCFIYPISGRQVYINRARHAFPSPIDNYRYGTLLAAYVQLCYSPRKPNVGLIRYQP